MGFKEEIERRRTFGIISHPDAGKTTLTEKLLLFGGAIHVAGAVKSNKIKKTATSDFMEIERQRGISVATSVMGFEYNGIKINILDTPGHQDFAEDTFRTLTACDSVIIVIDAAKGVETQTRKLMQVCRMRKTPVIVFINKLDRPANDPFEGIEITDTRSDELDHHIGERAAGKLREDLELIQGVYPSLDRQEYLDAHVAPVFFGSALNNFGIRELLDCFIEIAPAPLARETEERPVRPEEEKFTGFVFKIHANMDPNHRDRIAFVKICSGIFKRNTNYLHVRNGKMLKFSTPTAFMASKKSVIDEAYPGDIIGLHDTGTFKIGDTLTEGEKLHFKGIPSFSPELFKYIENADPMKSKQLAKGIDQLMDEGVAQLFVSQFNNRKIIGTVGALQFEVIEYRLLHEYAAACRWEPINLYKACWIEAQDQAELEDFKKHKAQYMAKDKEGRDVFLADSQYMLHMAQENYKKLIFHFTSEF